MARGIHPTRDLEREVLAGLGPRAILAGVDEVGRGSLAGPVSVGICLIDASTSNGFPAGLRDSKLLSPARREVLDPQCRRWGMDLAVGHAGPEVIDAEGIIVALRRAAAAGLAQLAARGHTPDAVLLDGRHDWWAGDSMLPQVPVRMQVKGDASCCVIAAASVSAKVERDHMMVMLDHQYPGYDWASNKGYASARHVDGLRTLGPSPMHRRSWHLPGVSA